MKKIVECVPNFSEGRNPETIEAIAEAIRKHPAAPCWMWTPAPPPTARFTPLWETQNR
jgi:hypothetical protein